MPVLGSPQVGMMTDPCREGGGEGARKPGTRGWRHADRRRGSTQDGDTGARRTETQEHAGRKRGDTQDRDAGARRTETAGTRRRKWTRNRQNCGKSGILYPTSSRNSARCVYYKQKGPVAKTTGPRFNVRCGYSSAATGSSVAAADSHDEQSVHSPAGSAHAAGSTAAGSETAAGSPAGSSVTARNSASSVWSS